MERRPNSTSPFLFISEKETRRIIGCGKFERKVTIKYDLIHCKKKCVTFLHKLS